LQIGKRDSLPGRFEAGKRPRPAETKPHPVPAGLPSAIFNSQFSICNSQFAIFNSQFSICNSQFAICNLQSAFFSSRPRYCPQPPFGIAYPHGKHPSHQTDPEGRQDLLTADSGGSGNSGPYRFSCVTFGKLVKCPRNTLLQSNTGDFASESSDMVGALPQDRRCHPRGPGWGLTSSGHQPDINLTSHEMPEVASQSR